MLWCLAQLTSSRSQLSFERVRALNVLKSVRVLHLSSRDTRPDGLRIFRSLVLEGTRIGCRS